MLFAEYVLYFVAESVPSVSASEFRLWNDPVPCESMHGSRITLVDGQRERGRRTLLQLNERRRDIRPMRTIRLQGPLTLGSRPHLRTLSLLGDVVAVLDRKEPELFA